MLAPGADRSSGKAAWRGRAISVAMALLVIGPWWIRNCVVLDAFMPFGTQGALNLPAGFGPRALRFQGLWMSNPGDGAPEIAALKLDPVASEVRLAQYRSALALRWIREHPLDALRLMGLHVWEEVKPRRLPYPTGAWLWPVAALAAVYLRRSAAVRVIVLMVAANALGIALTWSARGQLTPGQPMRAALRAARWLVAVAPMSDRFSPAGFARPTFPQQHYLPRLTPTNVRGAHGREATLGLELAGEAADSNG